MQTRRKMAVMLGVIVILGFAIRFSVWVYPMYGAQGLIIFDTGAYPIFGLSYIQALTSMNLSALARINVGVPPLGMLLTGLTTQAFGQHIGPIQASLIPPITASALTAIPAYMIAKKIHPKHSLIPSIIVAMDPFLIQFSATYLDSIGTLFALTSVAFAINHSDRRSFILAVLFASLAALSKLTFAVFIAVYGILLVLLRQMSLKRGAVYILVPAASLFLSPWAWTPTTLQEGVTGNIQFNNLPLSPLLGPFAIGIPQSLPWYILSYFGLGQVFWNTLPFISPLILLFMIVYRFFKRELYLPLMPSIATSAMILTIFLLPRNYWTYSWAGGAVQGILSRQFYPYYFYPTGPFIAVLAGILLSGRHDNSVKSRLLSYPIFMAALVSPMAVIMNLGLPYWDFIFTIIYNLTAGQFILEGIIATLITTAMLVVLLLVTEKLYRSITAEFMEPRKQQTAGQ
ncbi:MAG: hypothetical protein QXK84_04205 [Nitrososphaerota archaeon]